MTTTEKQILARKKWNSENKDKMREYQRNHYQRNKLEIKIKNNLKAYKMRTENEQQKESRLKRQREYNSRNKDKIKAYKHQYHLDNLEKVRAQQKINRIKRKENVEFKESPKKAKVQFPLFHILDTLRTDNNHYLWKKEVFNWTEKDLCEFKKLRSLSA